MANCNPYDNEWALALDEALTGPAQERFEAHLDECPACQADFEAMNQIASDLRVMGDEITADVPEIDLTLAIMRRVERMDASQPAQAPKKLEMSQSQSVRHIGRWIFTAAIAATAVFAIFLTGTGRLSAPGPHERSGMHARNHKTPDADTVRQLATNFRKGQGSGRHQDTMNRAAEVLEKSRQAHSLSKKGLHAGGQLTALTIDDILNARKTDDGSSPLDRLRAFASLSPEAVRLLAEKQGISPEALAAAADALPPSEAQDLLRKAVKANPNDPALRLALAEALKGEPGQENAANEELEQAAALDPENAIPAYMMVANAFESEGAEAGLSALKEAQERTTANMYTAKASQGDAEALEAAGFPRDVARLLASLTAGSDQYASLLNLGADLVEQGLSLADQGDLESAQQIFESVYQLGEQMYGQASYSYEQLAGIDLMRSTLEFLDQIYQVIGSQEDLAWLDAEFGQFMTQITDLSTFLDSLDIFLNNLSSGNYSDAFAQIVLNQGDLSLSFGASE